MRLRRRFRRGVRPVVVLLVVAGLVGASTSLTASQEAPEPDPVEEIPELPPAPPGFTAEISSVYVAGYQVVQRATSLGVTPPEGAEETPAPSTPQAFNDRLAELTDDDLAMFHAVTSQVPAWATLPASLGQLADELAQTVRLDELLDGQRAADRSAEGEEAGANLAAAEEGMAMAAAGIAPPPDPFIPSSPVVPGEFTDCPPEPPGGNQGNQAVYTAALATTAAKTVLELVPKSIEIMGEEIPNPGGYVAAVIAEVIELAGLYLGWLKDIYNYCEGENQYALNFNSENTILGTWELSQRLERTLAGINDGVITVSGQLEAAQGANDESLILDLHRALAADPDGVPNVAYQLPVSQGGFLDATPIGVQAVVTDSMAAAQRAGLPVNGAARQYLALADAALADGRYADAYRLYQASYQELGR